jgi:hypothetical protein
MVAQVLPDAWQSTGMPTFLSCAAGPTPDSSRTCGEPIAPPLKTISPASS